MQADRPHNELKGISHLRSSTRKWLNELVAVYVFEPAQKKLLILAGESWDRHVEARQLLKKEGLTIKDRFDQIKRHPAVAVERDSRRDFALLLKQLRLDLDPPQN